MGARSSGPVPSVKCAGAWPVNTLTPAGSSVETFRKEVRDLAEDRIDPDAKRGREEAGPLNVEPRREPAGHRSDHRRVAGLCRGVAVVVEAEEGVLRGAEAAEGADLELELEVLIGSLRIEVCHLRRFDELVARVGRGCAGILDLPGVPRLPIDVVISRMPNA